MGSLLDRLSGRRSRQKAQAVQRSIVLSDIVAREKRAAVAVASATDFNVRFARTLGEVSDGWPGTPYCFSYARERLILTVCPDQSDLFRAPFLWKAQYDQALQITTVPFERLHEFPDGLPARPIFVFSIGRCGSTLFSALLNACRVHTLSEPDILTQLAIAGPEDRARMGQDMRALIMQTCVSTLCRNAEGPAAVKLRSQCNGMASEIADSFADARFVVILRNRHSWARSRLRAFGGEPKSLAMLYRRGIQTYHELHERGTAPLLVWYEELIANPAKILGLLGVAPAMEKSDLNTALDFALEEDSQAGTPLERSKLSERPLADALLRDFDAEWENIRPDSLIRLHSLDGIE